MAAFIPFVHSASDRRLAARYYRGAHLWRVALDRVAPLKIPADVPLWLDPAVDGLVRYKHSTDEWKAHLARYTAPDALHDPSFWKKPNADHISSFVHSILDACATHDPSWITVPQLPVASDASRNKINRRLADLTADWSHQTRFDGALVLPLVFTHQNQLNLKTARNKKLELALDCYDRARADIIWTVDSSLKDYSGSPTLPNKRFPGLISLHEEIRDAFPADTVVIAGPYWAMNLVLWARGLIDHPAVGVGSSYQYHVSGGHFHAGNARIPVSALRRQITATPQARTWLRRARDSLSPADASRQEFDDLHSQFAQLRDRDTAKERTAKVYREWLRLLGTTPKGGRPVALFNDFSSAYVLGRALPTLSQLEKTAARPERPAQQFMMFCL